MKKDVQIIGSGFFGAVLAERLASQNNIRVEIIERRDHFGGNSYSEIDKNTGINFHKYGTHIFHTSNKKVWVYINKFTKFNNYKHQVFSRSVLCVDRLFNNNCFFCLYVIFLSHVQNY